mmetsp:Transcript_131895/g.282043  ORF Transcript_131895/g.282043 Transcript_131895/m.282043 type:complete len:351 (-) Transcript_131895:844-1896(-)
MEGCMDQKARVADPMPPSTAAAASPAVAPGSESRRSWPAFRGGASDLTAPRGQVHVMPLSAMLLRAGEAGAENEVACVASASSASTFTSLGTVAETPEDPPKARPSTTSSPPGGSSGGASGVVKRTAAGAMASCSRDPLRCDCDSLSFRWTLSSQRRLKTRGTPLGNVALWTCLTFRRQRCNSASPSRDREFSKAAAARQAWPLRVVTTSCTCAFSAATAFIVVAKCAANSQIPLSSPRTSCAALAASSMPSCALSSTISSWILLWTFEIFSAASMVSRSFSSCATSCPKPDTCPAHATCSSSVRSPLRLPISLRSLPTPSSTLQLRASNLACRASMLMSAARCGHSCSR